jgi:hypothetical protein
MCARVEQGDAVPEVTLKLNDRLAYGRSGHQQLLGRLSEIAAFRSAEKHLDLPQLEVPI